MAKSKKGAPPAAHLETVRRRHGERVYTQHLIRTSYREDGKVKHQTVANVSHLPPQVIDLLRLALKGETFLPAEAFQVVRSLPHGHVAAVLNTARRLGLESIVSPSRTRERDLVLAMVVMRVIHPASKLATARGLCEQTGFTSLRELLGVEEVDEEALYAALDFLAEEQEKIESRLARQHLEEGALILYDLTSAAYTGTHCALACFGHPPEGNGRHRYRQIRIGLMCNDEGVPVATEVFPGNTIDSTTVGAAMEKVRRRFGVRRVVLVGDRGTLTEVALRKELAPGEHGWITALRAPAVRTLVEAGALQLSVFDEQDLAEIVSSDYPGERLIACRNPLLAEERARKREEMLKATETMLEKVAAATRRARRPLRGAAKIGLRVGKVMNRYHMAKHFQLHVTDGAFTYTRDAESVGQEAALDGVYVIRTTVPADELDADKTVRAYKSLSRVERAFRSLKSVDLKVRPFWHRLEKRVKAHVFMCMLAYYVEWHMRQALAPILFDDDDREAAEALRGSIVAPAQRSPAAEAKAQTRRTERDEPVHSFQTLFEDLATIAKNTIVFEARGQAGSSAPSVFTRITVPRPHQKRALDLLRVGLV